MMPLDFMAAQAVARARLLERACHDPGPWEMEIEDLRVPAVRVRTPSRVVFLGAFPDICWLRPPDVVRLYCAGDLIGVEEIVAPAEGAHTVTWSIGLEPEPERASIR